VRPPPLTTGSSAPLAQRHDTALLDLDGVVYVGDAAVPGAAEALAAAAQRGMRLAYVTNNASRTPEAVADHLRRLGVPATADDVVTSAQAAAREVAARVPAGGKVLVVGGEGLRAALREHGLSPVETADDAPAAVVQGFSPDVGWALLTEGTLAVATGIPWVASNLDRTIPTARGRAPGNGTLVDVIATATGRRPDVVAGKPQLPLHREAILRSGARDPLVVGDRLDTDIEGANRGGAVSLLVLTGVSGVTELLGAPEARRPTFVALDLRGLLEPHPPVTNVEGGWRCRGWTAHVREGVLALAGKGGADDALRAACVAMWGLGGSASVDTSALTTLDLPR
jgi:HAD superfamily hydrolase (TIGR01450 family)